MTSTKQESDIMLLKPNEKVVDIIKITTNKLVVSTNISDMKFNADVSVPRTTSTWRLISRLATVYMYIAMIPAGIAHGILSTAFLELGYQTGADVEQLALLFTWNCAGRMLSAIIVGLIMDKFHPEMQLGMISLLYMICTTVVPLTRSYIAVAVNIAIQGFYGGYLSTGGTSIMFYLFLNREDSPSLYIQANYFAMAVGSFIGPFIVKPFLSTQFTTNTTIAQYNINASSDIHLEIESKFMGISIIQAGTFYPYMSHIW